MYTLEIEQKNTIDLGGGLTFEDSYFISIYTAKSKMEIRKHIEDHNLQNEKLRLVGPGGSVSNPMKIKLQQNGSKVNPLRKAAKEKGKHRIADDMEPVIMPTDPMGRMRLLLLQKRREEQWDKEEQLTSEESFNKAVLKEESEYWSNVKK